MLNTHWKHNVKNTVKHGQTFCQPTAVNHCMWLPPTTCSIKLTVYLFFTVGCMGIFDNNNSIFWLKIQCPVKNITKPLIKFTVEGKFYKYLVGRIDDGSLSYRKIRKKNHIFLQHIVKFTFYTVK